MKLNLGCGKCIKKGFTNLDIVKSPGVDIIHNLEKTPLPFKESQFEFILSDNVMEHIENFLPLMKELHRISKKDAIIEIIVPHFRSVGAYADPTHKRFFTTSTFDYFEKDNPNSFYVNTSFKIQSKKITFSYKDAKTARAKVYNLIIKPIELLANLNPDIYDRLLSHLIPPLGIIFKLKVIK